MPKILLVEDDKPSSDLLKSMLEAQLFTVEQAFDGHDALERLQYFPFDLALVDWLLPGIDGPSVVQRYRAAGGQIPILMLTGKRQVSDKEQGFDCGADDYLTKPYEPRELLARVKALLRRPSALRPDVLECRNVRLEPSSGRAWVADKEVSLLHYEFVLLEFLMRHPGQMFTAEHLLDKVWKSDVDSTDMAVRTTVARLRKKIELDDGGKPLIVTVRGFGYKIEP